MKKEVGRKNMHSTEKVSYIRGRVERRVTLIEKENNGHFSHVQNPLDLASR